MRTWKWSIDEGIHCASDGSWLTYGDFGRDTYGLHCKIDGKSYRIRLFEDGHRKITDAADYLLDRLATGWRPINW